jgi:hypothetical protein
MADLIPSSELVRKIRKIQKLIVTVHWLVQQISNNIPIVNGLILF